MFNVVLVWRSGEHIVSLSGETKRSTKVTFNRQKDGAARL